MATWAKTDTPGKFRVRASIGSDHNGTRRRPKTTIHATTRTIQALADAWEADLRARLADDTPAPAPELADDDDPASSPTFAETLRAYIDVTAVAEEWGAQHRDSREAALAAIEATELGAIPMDELRRAPRHLRRDSNPARQAPGARHRSFPARHRGRRGSVRHG